MAGIFQIKRGRRANLCDEFLNPLITLEEGCWYLCIDTAELFVSNDGMSLTKLNAENTFDSTDIYAQLNDLKSQQIKYVKVEDEGDIPQQVDDPYIVYYSINSTGDSANTYIYDSDLGRYVCTGTSSHQDLTQEKLNSMIQLIHGGDAIPDSL